MGGGADSRAVVCIRFSRLRVAPFPTRALILGDSFCLIRSASFFPSTRVNPLLISLRLSPPFPRCRALRGPSPRRRNTQPRPFRTDNHDLSVP